jgi:hypothetical protein
MKAALLALLLPLSAFARPHIVSASATVYQREARDPVPGVDPVVYANEFWFNAPLSDHVKLWESALPIGRDGYLPEFHIPVANHDWIAFHFELADVTEPVDWRKRGHPWGDGVGFIFVRETLATSLDFGLAFEAVGGNEAYYFARYLTVENSSERQSDSANTFDDPANYIVSVAVPPTGVPEPTAGALFIIGVARLMRRRARISS